MAGESEVIAQLERIERSIQLIIKLKLADAQAGKSQKETILMLGSLGCSAAEIADLLGVARTSVAPTLSRAMGKKRGKG